MVMLNKGLANFVLKLDLGFLVFVNLMSILVLATGFYAIDILIYNLFIIVYFTIFFFLYMKSSVYLIITLGIIILVMIWSLIEIIALFIGIFDPENENIIAVYYILLVTQIYNFGLLLALFIYTIKYWNCIIPPDVNKIMTQIKINRDSQAKNQGQKIEGISKSNTNQEIVIQVQKKGSENIEELDKK